MRIDLFSFLIYTLVVFVGCLSILFIINWNDEEYLSIPEYPDQPGKISKSDNMYYVIAGFNAAAGENIQDMGYKIIHAFEAFAVNQDETAFNVEDIKNASVLNFNGDESILCKPYRDGLCLPKIKNNKTALIELENQNQTLYERYRTLINYKRYQEGSYYIPTWSGIFNTHYLHLNLIGLEWKKGNKNRAIKMLQEAVNFTHLVYSESDLLINHLIGLALLQNTLMLQAELLKECNSCDDLKEIATAIPQLTKNQICMKKQFYSEIDYAKRLMANTRTYGAGYEEQNDKNLALKIWHRYFGKKAATFNEYYRLMNNIFNVCDMPSYKVKEYETKNSRALFYDFPWYRYLYNPAGKYILEFQENSNYNLYSYIYSAIELEGLIRLLKSQALIYRNNIVPSNINDYLNQLPDHLKNPYTNNPFKYDKKAHLIYFTSGINSESENNQLISIKL